MKWIKPSRISGRIQAPASKSLMIRASAAAALSHGGSLIRNPSFCDDALAGLRAAEALGGRVSRTGDGVRIEGGAGPVSAFVNCGESALCLRLFAPIFALFDRETTLSGEGSLVSRPMRMLEPPLAQMGVAFGTKDGRLPLSIRGPLRNGKVRIDGSISSQLLSGLLTALPLFSEDSEIRVDGLKSKPYVALTMSLLARFGISIEADPGFSHFRIKGGQSYRSVEYRVEGDWSGASFVLAAAAIRGEAIVTGLSPDSPQADRRVLEALRAAGAEVITGEDAVTVRRRHLRAFEFDATDCPDLFPPLAALALSCSGTSRIAGAGRLKHKESDRAAALVEELSGLGAAIEVRGDALEVAGSRIRGGTLDSRNDHRIAMAGAVAGLASGSGVRIEGAECVAKSYPRFFEDLESLGGDVS
ncbi:MAG: 3-phosphoshikimate 1-carboxyvinyltransferase [Candidatus Aminicenantes bacterium RBG_16_66_30]